MLNKSRKFFKRTKVPPLKCLYFFHYKTRTKKWQVKFINILFCYKHLCSPLKVFSFKVRGKKDGDQLHIQGTFAWCHIRCTPPIWRTTAIADLDGLSGMLHQCDLLRWMLALVAWPRKCSAGLSTPELLVPHSHIVVSKRKLPCLAMGRKGEFCPFSRSNEYAQICFTYSAWWFGFYFPFISVINHLSLALSIHGLLSTLFSFLSWSNFGHWGLFSVMPGVPLAYHTTVFLWTVSSLWLCKTHRSTAADGFPVCGKWLPVAVYLTGLHSTLQWAPSLMQVKTEHRSGPVWAGPTSSLLEQCPWSQVALYPGMKEMSKTDRWPDRRTGRRGCKPWARRLLRPNAAASVLSTDHSQLIAAAS